MADLPLVVLPHPLSSKSEQEIRVLAEKTIEEVEFALAAGADEVAARYHLRVTPVDITLTGGFQK